MKPINIVFDGNYLLHKTFSVIRSYNPDAKTADELFKDEKLKGIFLRKMIIDACAVLNKVKAPISKVIFVFDSNSWRYKIHPDYKHKLSKPRDEDYTKVFEVMESLIKRLTKSGFIVTKVPEMEGDDLLYFWSLYFSVYDEDCLLVTGDGDMHQLAGENVSIFNNNSKNLNIYATSNKELLNEPSAKLNIVNPSKLAIRKILLGDSGDNVPSVKKGFGEKTFEKFIEGFVEVDTTSVDAMASDLNRYLKAFLKTNDDYLEKIKLNIRLVYLSHIIYGDEAIQSALDSMATMHYTYKGSKFTLEEILDMKIK